MAFPCSAALEAGAGVDGEARRVGPPRFRLSMRPKLRGLGLPLDLALALALRPRPALALRVDHVAGSSPAGHGSIVRVTRSRMRQQTFHHPTMVSQGRRARSRSNWMRTKGLMLSRSPQMGHCQIHVDLKHIVAPSLRLTRSWPVRTQYSVTGPERNGIRKKLTNFGRGFRPLVLLPPPHDRHDSG